MPETSPISATMLGYEPAEPSPLMDTPPSVSDDDDTSSHSSDKEEDQSQDAEDPKTSLRKLMVSCIDSALEELGPLSDIAPELQNSKPVLPPLSSSPSSSSPSSSMPTAEQLYGYSPASSSKLCPELKLRGRIRRSGGAGRPRYQRRGSVTKFSLGDALKQVQKEDRLGKLGELSAGSTPTTSLKSSVVVGRSTNPLWYRSYQTKMMESASRPSMKRTALDNFRPSLQQVLGGAEQQGPAMKRRRACL